MPEFDEDHVMSGLTPYKARGMVGRILRNSSGVDRFKLFRRDEISEFIEDEAMKESNSIETRLQCVGHVLKMESLNLEYQKLQVQVELAVAKIETEGDADGKSEQQVILVLPPNGSEVQSA